MIIVTVFHEALVRPLFNLLVLIAHVVPAQDLGIAIILLTLLTRVVFYPLAQKGLRSQTVLQNLQPRIKELQRLHKDNRAEQSKAVMALYRENKVSPFASIVPMLIQLPILFALYRVFLNGLDAGALSDLYSFVTPPQGVNTVFLGILDLTRPSPVLAVLAGAFQFLQSWLTFAHNKQGNAGAAGGTKPSGIQKMLGRQMLYVMPFFTIVIALRFPAGLALYWAVTTLFSAFQQYSINRSMKKKV